MHRLEDREKERKRAIERNEEEGRQRQIERGRLSGAPNLRGKHPEPSLQPVLCWMMSLACDSRKVDISIVWLCG